MPSGNYKSTLNEDAMEKLQSWIKKGGKVIAIDRALSAFADKEGFSLKRFKTDEDEDKENNDKNNLIPYADRKRENAKQMILEKLEDDVTHEGQFFACTRGLSAADRTGS